MEQMPMIQDGEIQEIAEEVMATEGPKVDTQVVVSVYETGAFEVSVPQDMRQLSTGEIEMIIRAVYDNLHDTRVAQQALEIFKSKL